MRIIKKRRVLWDRFNADKTDQLWYLRSLAEAFKRAGAKQDLTTEFEGVVAALETMCKSQGCCGKTFVGIDGCKAGWVIISLDEAGKFIDISIASSFKDAVSRVTEAETALVDIPIGLRESGPERECDKKARGLLGPRKSSLFPVPVRKAVHAATYFDACQVNDSACGRKISQQTWAICPKIAEVDDIFTSNAALQLRIRETHPEVCFTSLNNWIPMDFSKKTRAGTEERLQLLRKFSANADPFYQAAVKAYPSAEVLADDIIDAMVCAVTARAANKNEFPTIPPGPETDKAGLKMEMVCAVSLYKV